jgi:hypothetical protein
VETVLNVDKVVEAFRESIKDLVPEAADLDEGLARALLDSAPTDEPPAITLGFVGRRLLEELQDDVMLSTRSPWPGRTAEDVGEAYATLDDLERQLRLGFAIGGKSILTFPPLALDPLTANP